MKKLIMVLMILFIATTASANFDSDSINRAIASDLAVFAKDYAKEIYGKDDAMTVAESLNKLKKGGYEKHRKSLVEAIIIWVDQELNKQLNDMNNQEKAELHKQITGEVKPLVRQTMELIIIEYNKEGRYLLLNPREYSNFIYLQFYE